MSAFDLSYRSLDPAHQRLFRRLGMNLCPDVSLPAAAVLSGGTLSETEAALGVLLDHHLLTRSLAGRFRFHDLIREYAATRAASEDPRSEQGRPSAGCWITTCTRPTALTVSSTRCGAGGPCRSPTRRPPARR